MAAPLSRPPLLNGRLIQAEEIMKAILVTGGNDGIGLALCTQLAVDHGCRVFMGSRSLERGEAAVAKIAVPEGGAGEI